MFSELVFVVKDSRGSHETGTRGVSEPCICITCILPYSTVDPFPEIKKLTLTSLAPDSNIKTICLPISFDRFFRCYQHRPPVFISHKQILRFQGHELGALGMAAAGAACAVHTALLDFASESFDWQVGTLPKANIAPETRPSQKVSNLQTIHFQGLR